jgi:hypothetical protein
MLKTSILTNIYMFSQKIYNNTMKTKILILITTLLSFSSCEKDEIILSKNNTQTQNRLLDTNNLMSFLLVVEKNKS